MKKIMFSDKYSLTKAVLEGRKTMTRRAVPERMLDEYYDYDDWVRSVATHDIPCSREYEEDFFLRRSHYEIGDVVAVSQAYKDVYDEMSCNGTDSLENARPILAHSEDGGWDNKMFVRADLMPHRIKITGIKVERLQDISEHDCFKEGIYKKTLCPPGDIDYFYHSEPRSKWEVYPSARDAFASLIDKVSGNGTWECNPWVFVYEFELVEE